MSWGEQNAVDYVFGLAKNSRLVRSIGAELQAAYVLMHALRRVGLKNTALARACARTIRLKLLKIGAVVGVSVRRAKLAMSEACANQREFIAAFHALSAAAR